MFGDAFSLHNVTDIHFQRFVQIHVNGTQYNDEFINYTKRLIYPWLTLSVQITMALFINTRINSAMRSIINRLNLPSYRASNIPFMVSILFVLFSGYFRSFNNYLFYHIPLSEQLKNFFSEIHVFDVVSEFFYPDSSENSRAHLLSLGWIVVHFFLRPTGAKNCKVDEKSEIPEIETLPIVEVQVISEKGTVDEKETVEKKENLNVD
ncbi:uncharacterized protein LOC130666027 [Microplitis mediator]|uniref:uncharacterized protein LOC130666027 n=1 Tax=Microplitis mediator TaxID=375433 RepID=UPI00255619B0|nr:uncharacterized protein LOC130666027 [Microplitis mediator]